MPSDTLFTCLLCHHKIDPRPPVHSCQKECVREAGIHVDICSHCFSGIEAIFTGDGNESSHRPERERQPPGEAG